MLTPGFKLFFGLAVLAVVGAVVYGVATGDPSAPDYLGIVDRSSWKGVFSLGWQGGVGEHTGYVILVFAAITAGGLACLLVAFRDADASSVGELAPDGKIPPTQAQPQHSFWPVVGAFAVAVTAIGLVIHAAIFVVGLILLGVVIFEWMASAWSDRATGDAAANRALRNRIMQPIEIPVLAAAGIAVLVLGGSRVLLAVSEFSAVWIAAGVAAVILAFAVLFVARPKIGKSAIAGVLALGAAAVVAAGIVAAAIGPAEHGGHEGEDDHSAEQVEESAEAVGTPERSENSEHSE